MHRRRGATNHRDRRRASRSPARRCQPGVLRQVASARRPLARVAARFAWPIVTRPIRTSRIGHGRSRVRSGEWPQRHDRSPAARRHCNERTPRATQHECRRPPRPGTSPSLNAHHGPLPSEASDDPSLVTQLVEHGIDIARITCAHDDKTAWAHVVDSAGACTTPDGRSVRVAMDPGGPTLRTGPAQPGSRAIRIALSATTPATWSNQY